MPWLSTVQLLYFAHLIEPTLNIAYVCIYREIQITFCNRAFASGFRMVTVVSSQHRSDYHHQQQLHQDQEETITGCVVERTRNVNDIDQNITSTCQVGTIVRLRANQTLAIATLHGYYRPMLTTQHLTYWGLYKIE